MLANDQHARAQRPSRQSEILAGSSQHESKRLPGLIQRRQLKFVSAAYFTLLPGKYGAAAQMKIRRDDIDKTHRHIDSPAQRRTNVV